MGRNCTSEGRQWGFKTAAAEVGKSAATQLGKAADAELGNAGDRDGGRSGQTATLHFLSAAPTGRPGPPSEQGRCCGAGRRGGRGGARK